MPWQRAAADVVGEQDAAGRYVYPTAVILVPRQCGKTTFAFDLALGRGLRRPDYRAAYAAQTGHVTTERFTERIDQIERTPMRQYTRTRRSQGTERIVLPRGSYLKAFPPKSGALRSNALDLVIVDEAQEHDEELGRELDATIVPVFNTRPARQLILIGTAGTARSKYLRRYLDEARAGTPGYCLIEYGFPDTADPADEAVWEYWHPGLTSGLTDVDTLRDARTNLGNDAAFMREYGNVWSVGADLSPFDAAAWSRARVDPFGLEAGAVALAFDVAFDRSESAIAAACYLPDGREHVRVLEVRPGAAWLAGRVEEIARQLRADVVCDEYGPSVDVAATLRTSRTGPRLAGYNGSELAAACMGLAAAINDGRCTHAGQAPLDAASAVVTRRRIGDRWVFDRRVPGLPVSPLMAAGLARHALTSRPARKKPVARA